MSRRTRALRLAPLIAALALTSCASASGATVRVGHAPLLPAGSRTVATLPPDRTMRITLALSPRDPAALTRYAEAVSDPASAEFRRFLRPAQFARRFAPSPSAVAAVEGSLRSRGLSPGRLSADGLAIPVRASVSAIEHAFATTLAEVRLPGSRAAVVNTLAPALDARVAGSVQAVIGLESLDRPFSSRAPASQAIAAAAPTSEHFDTGGPEPCAEARRAATAQDAYTSDQIATAYGFSDLYDAGDEGAGTTIAAYELESDDPADIAAFQGCYGTDASVTYVKVDGGVKPGPGTGEAALDLEQLISLAPKANLIVYQAPNSNYNGPGAGPYDELNTIVSQDRAQVISDSWGQCEPEEGLADAQAENVLLEEAAVQGETVLASAGDSGSEDCFNPQTGRGGHGLEVDDPASQPFVTGVGGSSMSAIGPPPSESAWNSRGNGLSLLGGEPGAGGGGISGFWPMPTYQSGAAAALGVTSKLSSGAPCHIAAGDCREVPDVSADADPEFGYLIFYNGSGNKAGALSGWQGTGGTSASAPVWAALVALADASSSCAGSSIGFANPILYQLAGVDQAAYFHPILSGNNDLTGSGGGLYPASGGYNMATGLGSPIAGPLAAGLCAGALRLAGPRAEEALRRAHVRIRLQAVAPAGAGAVVLSVTGLPRGLTFDAASAEIIGTARHDGRYRVRILATDAAGGRRTLRLRLTVAGKPAISRATLALAAGAPPILSLTVRAGRDEAGLRSVSLAPPPGLRFVAPGDVTVAAPGGKAVAHSASVHGGVLEVRLRRATGEITLECADGAVAAAPGVAHARLELRVQTRDADAVVVKSVEPVHMAG